MLGQNYGLVYATKELSDTVHKQFAYKGFGKVLLKRGAYEVLIDATETPITHFKRRNNKQKLYSGKKR